MKKPPKIPAHHWFFKNLTPFTENPIPYILSNRKKFGDVFEINTPFIRQFSINDPELIKYILATNNKIFHKSFAYRLLELALGKGLLTSEGEFWHKQRRIAQPAFYKERINALVSTMIESTQEKINSWKKSPNQTVDITHEMMVLTSTIAARTLVGADIQGDIDKLSQAISHGQEYLTYRINNPIVPPSFIPTKKNRDFHHHLKTLDEIVYGFIDHRIENTTKNKHDLLSLLIDARDEETGKGMSRKQLRDEVITLFVAGHETTAIALSWTFWLLAENPQCLIKLKKEIDHLDSSQIDMKNLHQLPYLNNVLNESMRLYPPAWIIGRKNMESFEFKDWKFPKGSQLIILPSVLHRHPDIWEHPNQFNPDRFKEENMKSKHKYAFFPFGGGPRFCIGNSFALIEMKIILTMVLKQFDFTLEPNQSISPKPLITLRPENGIQGKLSPRQNVI